MVTNALIVAPILIAGCAYLDRIIGWGKFGRTLPVIIGIAALTGAMIFAGYSYIVGLSIGLAFMIWRTPAWHLFGGTLDVQTPEELVGTFLRHLLALGFMVPAILAGISLPPVAVLCVIFAGVATYLSQINGHYVSQQKDINDKIELARGAFLGLILSIAFLFPF